MEPNPQYDMAPPAPPTLEFSPDIGELAAALALAQGEMKAAKKDSENPFFKSSYADLSQVWDSCRAALSKQKLAVLQPTSGSGEGVTIHTMIVHSSGQWVRGSLTLKPVKNDPQGVGSAITYARRYALAAMVGVVSDEDDDGNAASGKGSTPMPKRASETAAAAKPTGATGIMPQAAADALGATVERPKNAISEPQQKRLFALCKESGVSNETLKKHLAESFHIDSTKLITKDDYTDICTWVQDQKEPTREPGDENS